ncbi:MAG: DUF3291 domain-containing protein [Hyphomicrobiaceae bacterium]|nr:DUF3291 domain-containing protein [Hyphomicrobiaceae bacterium]
MATSNRLHLAQINIGRARYLPDDPRLADFMNALEFINGLAERSSGFIWRFKDDSGNATSTRVFDDPQVIVNMSVWENVESLEAYVWQTVHKRFYDRRGEWFEKLDGPHLAMWWIEPGHKPSLSEAKERLEYLETHGPTDFSFGWEEVPEARLWKTKRCA